MSRNCTNSRFLIASVVLAGICAAGSAAPFRVGLDFVIEPTEIEAFPMTDTIDGEVVYSFEYTHFAMTDPSTFAWQDGALGDYTQADLVEHITWQAEKIYRDVDTGDPNTTLAVEFLPGLVPTHLAGERRNIGLGTNIYGDTYLGFARTSSLSSDPQDSYGAVVLLDNIDALQGVTFTDVQSVVWAYSGVIAHEAGHMAGLRHLDNTAAEPPFPLMSTGSTGLSNPQRLLPRAATDIPDSQPLGSTVSHLIEVLGTVDRADLNMDGEVDVFKLDGQGDAQILLSNLGKSQFAFHREGDINGDGDVDVFQIDGQGDAQLLLASVASGSSQVMEASATYDPGQDTLLLDLPEGTGVVGLTGLVLDPQASPTLGEAISTGTDTVWFDVEGLAGGQHVLKGVTGGGSPGQSRLVYTLIGGGTYQADVAVVPEPGLFSLLAIGGLAAMRRRKR
ncbi:MAG: PEP-CTERM sorting domain-containing protein [Phycisphaerae bacterium]